MDKQKAWAVGLDQLAVDFNARPEDFRTEGITYTTPALNPGRRAYGAEMPFFELVTVGAAAVIMAREELWPQLKDWAKDVEESHWLLEFPRLLKLSAVLEPYGYGLTQTFHHYLPVRDFAPVAAPEGLALKWLEQEDLAAYYPNRDWPNALQGQANPARPDTLALLALDGDTPAGMAGASMDSPTMWQIGIDVLPAYRGKGLGALLVQGLACEVEKRGALPFYGTSLSNIHSQNIAWKCGFRPAWVAVSARKKEGQCG